MTERQIVADVIALIAQKHQQPAIAIAVNGDDIFAGQVGKALTVLYPICSPIREGSEKLSCGILLAAQTTMRATLTATILLSALLAGCASTKDGPGNKNISQAGALKVHPALLGQPVPAELQQEMRQNTPPVSEKAAPGGK